MASKVKPRLVLILGSPRSGSTMLHQLMARSGSFNYVSNCEYLFYWSPARVSVTAARIMRDLKIISSKRITLESRYGSTPALSDPHECGRLYRRFINSWNTSAPIKKDDPGINKLATYLDKRLLATSKPLLLKNLYLAEILSELCTCGLDPVVIHIVRGKENNGKSLYKASYDIREQDGACLGPFVDELPFSKYSDISEAIQHVDLCNNRIEAISSSNSLDYLKVSYEKLSELPPDPSKIDIIMNYLENKYVIPAKPKTQQ